MTHRPSTHALHLLFASALGLAACGDSVPPPEEPQAPVAPAANIAEPPPAAPAAEPTAEPAAATPAPAPEKIKEPDVIYVPTPQPVVDRMLQEAKVKKTDVVYDLGCGDGRIVVTAAKKYGARGFGYDVDPKRVAEAKENVKKAGVENLVTIEQKDIFTLDLSPASVVTLYLLPRLNVQLLPQLEKLKPGSRVVTHDFDIEGYKPEKRIDLKAVKDDHDQAADHVIYSFITPFKPVAAK